jgi:hypothetical protein
MNNKSRVKQLIINILVIFFILFEEILWRKIAEPIFNEIKLLQITQRIKEKLEKVENEYSILILFFIPFIVMELFAYAAGLALINGYILLFVILYLLKGVAMLPMLFVFEIKKEVLLSFTVVAKPYKWLQWLLGSKIFRIGKIQIRRFKLKIRRKLKTMKETMDGTSSPILHKIAEKVNCLRNCILKG